MKITCIYIENFGALHAFRLEPEAGITQIIEGNGAGKSTLAVFIQTMFYGFPRAGKNLSKDTRRKYAPWQGGRFGGYLEFEFEEETYRLERYFGEKPVQDTFTLYLLNPLRLSSRFSSEIGIELFGLDSASWARSTYIPQLEVSEQPGVPGVLSGLTSLVENTEDVHRYDKAVAALRAKRSGLLPYRGQSGEIARTRTQILELEDSCRRLSEDRKELPLRIAERETLLSELATTKARCEDLEDQLSYAQEASWRGQIHREYLRLNKESEDIRRELTELGNRYPLGFPDEEALEDAESTLQTVDRAEFLQLQAEYEEREAALKALSEEFPRGLPSEEELETLSSSYQEMLKALDQLDHNDEKIREDHLANTPTASGFMQTGQLLIFSVISLVAGLLLLLMKHTVPGSLFMLLGVAILMYVIIKNQFLEADAEEEASLLTEQDPLRVQIAEKNKELETALLSYFDHTSMGEYHIQLKMLSGALKNTAEHSQKRETLGIQIKEKQDQIWKAQVHLQSFCQQYGIPMSGISRKILEQMRIDRLRYKNLQENYRSNADRLSSFLLDHGPEAANEVETDIQELPDLKEQLAKTARKKEQLERELAEHNELERRLRERADQLPEFSDQLQQKKEYLKACQKEAALLDETLLHLQHARETLSVSYLGNIKKSFFNYYRQLSPTGNTDMDILLSTDLRLSLDVMGKMRELESFSAGSKDLYMFCMRLALTDALFPEEKPILILDDPFVNLDEVHMEKARELMHQMNGRQILYLSCQKDRAL